MSEEVMLSICPDCAAGEHHPFWEVTTFDLNHGVVACTCLCAEPVIGPTLLSVGETGFIFAGRWNDRYLHIDAISGHVYVGTVLNHLSQPTVVHVPTTWVRRLP